MTHPAMPRLVVPGASRFEWLAGERFLIQRATNHADFPDSVSAIGVMEGHERLSMQYFDSRGVRRIYQLAFDGEELRIWRDGFKDDAAIAFRRAT